MLIILLYMFLSGHILTLNSKKTTLSYAAIFGIRDDLNLHGTQYNWLSSIFYFGFLAWAFPTNFLMQRLPIGNSLIHLFKVTELLINTSP